MDQERLAGVGNLLADEILYRAGLAPGRRTPLTDDELRVLHKELRATLRQLGRRGGSHMGELMEGRGSRGAARVTGRSCAGRPWAAGRPTGARRTSTESGQPVGSSDQCIRFS